jgi:hypothetical protein
MTLGVIIVHIFFLVLLITYQKQDKIYIGYTTVLCILFSSVIGISVIDVLINDTSSERLLLLSLWILGSVLIYVVSQLTLAFEKITKLSKAIAMMDLEKQREQQSKSSKERL